MRTDSEYNTIHKAKRIYRRKHFYKITCVRSKELLTNCPWLKYHERDFCMMGYCQPTPQEAVAFIGDPIYDRWYDSAISVQEISKEEALLNFNMDNWANQKVFGADKLTERMCSLDDKILNAENHVQGLRSDGIQATKHPVR